MVALRAIRGLSTDLSAPRGQRFALPTVRLLLPGLTEKGSGKTASRNTPGRWMLQSATGNVKKT
jgi:hypothetical protein